MITPRALKRHADEISQVLEHANDLVVRVSTETVQKAETTLAELDELAGVARACLSQVHGAAQAHRDAMDRIHTLATFVLLALAGMTVVDAVRMIRSAAS